MAANYVALVFAYIGLLISFFLCRPLNQRLVRPLLVWTSGALLYFVSYGDPFIALFGTTTIAFFIAPTQPIDRIEYFVIVAPCLPDTIVWVLSAPGIETLGVINCYKLFVLALLLPLCFQKQFWRKSFSASEIGLIGYSALTSYIAGSASNLTSGLRFFLLNQLLVFVIPFMVVRRSVHSQRDLHAIMNGVVVASVVLGSMALLATLKQWDFYRLYEPYSIFNRPEYRDGWLRISTTTSLHSLAYHFVVALLFIEHLRFQGSLKLSSAAPIQCLLLSGLFFTHSRGASFGLAIALAIMLISRQSSIRLRQAGYSLFAIGCVLGGAYLIFADHTANDPYGTFKYRQDLLETSLDFIWANPLGDFDALSKASFAHLRQGQGIIDITNLYLLIMIFYGIPAAILLFGVIAFPIARLLHRAETKKMGLSLTERLLIIVYYGISVCIRLFSVKTSPTTTTPQSVRRGGASTLSKRTSESLAFQSSVSKTSDLETYFRSQKLPQVMGHDQNWDPLRAVIAGAIVGWLFLVVTTSDIGLTIHIGVMLTAFACCLLELRIRARKLPQVISKPGHSFSADQDASTSATATMLSECGHSLIAGN